MNAINKADGRRQLPAYDISSLKILILEKQSLMRSLMKQVFREFRVSEVEITADPVKAFEFVTQMAPDLILSDWSHDLDGLAFLEQVRWSEESPNPYVPVIVVTAHSEMRHVCQARDAGMSEFLAKPVSPETIYRRICAVIDQTRPFVRCDAFFGPDRRRRKAEFAGAERRDAA